jgi:GNAT superfamily N-acetyltransferase
MFVASAEDGHWVGMAGSGPLDRVPGTAVIHGVFVSPAHRGGQAGPAARLMEVGIEWARDHTDASWLTLGVHEHNDRARAFYRRFGFKDTDTIIPYVLDPSQRVHIMGYDGFR